MKEALFIVICLLLGGCASSLTTTEKRQRSFSPYEGIRIGSLRLGEFLALRTAFVISGDSIAGSATAIDKRGYFITAAHCLTGDAYSLLVPMWLDGTSEITFERRACQVVWRGDAAKREPDLAILAIGSMVEYAFEWVAQISAGINVVAAGLDVDTSGGESGQVNFAWFGGKIVSWDAHEKPPLVWRSILHSAPMHAGDSGGPIATSEGRLVGVSVKYGGMMLFFRGLRREPRSLALCPDLTWMQQIVESDFTQQSKKPNKAPEPTPRSVTPRAFLREVECPSWTDQPIPARVAPERVVAHL